MEDVRSPQGNSDQRSRGAARLAPALLPLLEGAYRGSQESRELALRHSDAIAGERHRTVDGRRFSGCISRRDSSNSAPMSRSASRSRSSCSVFGIVKHLAGSVEEMSRHVYVIDAGNASAGRLSPLRSPWQDGVGQAPPVVISPPTSKPLVAGIDPAADAGVGCIGAACLQSPRVHSHRRGTTMRLDGILCRAVRCRRHPAPAQPSHSAASPAPVRT